MKILFILSRVPWPIDKGDKLRAYHMIRHLSKNHDIYLFALYEEEFPEGAESELGKFCKAMEFCRLSKYEILRNLATGIFSTLPFQVRWFLSAKAQKRLRRFIEKIHPDLLFTQLIRMAPYTREIHGFPKVIDYQDAFSLNALRWVKNANGLWKWLIDIERRRVAAYEYAIAGDYDLRLIISDEDKQHMHLPEGVQLHTLPNGVDPGYFYPLQRKKDFEVLFTGNLSYPPNIDACLFLVREIMPMVWEQFPQAKVALAGTDPVKAVKNLAGRQVVVTGRMADIREAYARAKVFAAPMRMGAGMQNKLLEAMAMALPVVTSPIAAAPFIKKEMAPIRIAREPGQYASIIRAFLTDDALRSETGKTLRSYVTSNYSWDEIIKQLDDMVRQFR